MNIKTLSFGCRLNALECDKISNMLSKIIDNVILVNTCSVTGEAERQCAQTVRKLSRENPNAVIFVTGCGATRNPQLFSGISRVLVIDNKVNKTMLIITDNIEGMKSLILKDLERSGTVLKGRGMYLETEKNIIYTTVNRKEYNKIKYSAKKLDPKCFITIISNTETLGEGFTPLP